MKYEILIKPVVTEKSLKLVEEQNQYTFIVGKLATKRKVKEAIEKRFKVKVLNVKVLNIRGKKVVWGRKKLEGSRKSIKKAVVTLKSSDSIGLFKIK